ncbi:Rv1733c family protein [Mycobacterium sp. 4D054]|uniref:Rv1733c family protein n=1 Tax=Mycobacterium sp. 4D054 TaxID=3457440 RepID=UPI003FD11C6D
MQTFTLGLGVWLRRLLSRSPLVRPTDRVEATAVMLIAVASVLTVPVAGAVGTAEYDRLAHAFAAQRLSYRAVEATVVQDSRAAPQPYEKPYLTEVGWNFAGVAHTAGIRTYRMSAGEQLTISVRESGELVEKVQTDEDAAAQAVIVALGVWSAVTGLGAATWLLLRLRLDHLRFAAWDRDLDDLADNGGRRNNPT